jgi:hypothetical protein
LILVLGGHLLQSLFDFVIGARPLTELLIEFGIVFAAVVAVTILMEFCGNLVSRLIRKVVNWYVPLSAESSEGSRGETR